MTGDHEEWDGEFDEYGNMIIRKRGKDDYCGFVCADYVEKAREIRKALDEFAKYNPDEAVKVWHNIFMALGFEDKTKE